MEQPLQELFARHFGRPAEAISVLRGDGSSRKLFRLTAPGAAAIGVLNADQRENKAFLAFSRHFRGQGLAVPRIYAEDEALEAYLEEDLGDTTLFEFLSRGRAGEKIDPGVVEVYRRVVRTLPRFQITAGRSVDFRLGYPRAAFDKQSMMWDLNYFKYYFLRLARIPFNEQDLEDDFKKLTDFLLEARRDFFLYRDFQSRNIMVRAGRPWFIDYQGGRRGALQYDIASLLYDAKADLPFELREKLLVLYLEAAGRLIPLSRPAFLKHYDGYVLIRILQAMGTYGLRGFYERKSQFLQSIPYAIRNLEHWLANAEIPVELPALRGVLRRLVGSSRLRQFGRAALRLTVRVESFSYRGGPPEEESGHGGGYVFDCRALPNPGRQERYAELTGKDRPVIVYLKSRPEVRRFLGHVMALVDQTIRNYQGRNFTNLLVAFGCTGGCHRSVYCAEFLAEHLRRKHKVVVELRHRELEKE